MPVAQTSMREPTLSKKASALAGRKFLILALLLLTSLVLHPFVDNSRHAYLAFRLVGSAGILYTIYAINPRRTVLVCAVLLAVPALLQHWFQFS